MGLIERLRGWWRSAVGDRGSVADASPVDGAEETAFDYECAVCGTGVDDPDERCPLCRSSDVVPAGDDPRDADPGGGGRRHATDADDDSVERLRELRADGDLLRRHADRWQPTEGGFRVETPDGEVVVDSRADVVDSLRRHHE